MLLDIDVQGAEQMKQRYDEAVAVFVLPPSRKLAKRLRGRVRTPRTYPPQARTSPKPRWSTTGSTTTNVG